MRNAQREVVQHDRGYTRRTLEVGSKHCGRRTLTGDSVPLIILQYRHQAHTRFPFKCHGILCTHNGKRSRHTIIRGLNTTTFFGNDFRFQQACRTGTTQPPPPSSSPLALLHLRRMFACLLASARIAYSRVAVIAVFTAGYRKASSILRPYLCSQFFWKSS